MATPTLNQFSAFILTEQESHVGQIFTQENLYVLQNTLAEKAALKLALLYNPLNPQDFIQQQAYLTGQIALLQYLLECHSAEISSTSTSL